MAPLLVGTDGSQKMSKSLGNSIGINEPSDIIYKKVMSIPDNLILQYFELLTDVSNEEIDQFKSELENKIINPMILKKRLAREIITQLYSHEAANAAEKNFVREVQLKEVPEDIPTVQVDNEFPDIRRLLTRYKLVASTSGVVRLINQGAVKLDGRKVTHFTPRVKNGSVLQYGKGSWLKFEVHPPTVSNSNNH
jgi:tyrosyl-tRNA synthetase